MLDNDQLLQRFCTLYDTVGPGVMPDLAQVYAEDIEFIDPLARVEGRNALGAYLRQSYRNVIRCRFEYGEALMDADSISLPWVMELQHRRLAGRRTIQVDGMSLLKTGNGQVIRHRDYYDAGQLLYENVPILGAAVRWLRRYAA